MFQAKIYFAVSMFQKTPLVLFEFGCQQILCKETNKF